MVKKIFIPLLFLCFAFFNAFSQDVNKAMDYFNAGQYESAATEFEKVIPLLEKKYGSNDTSNYSVMIIYTAISYERSQQLADAEIYYRKAKEIYESIKAEDCQWYAVIMINLGGMYSTYGYYEKAEPYLLKAMQIEKKMLGKDHPEYAESLFNLAGLYQSMGKYEEAEPLYIETLQIIKKNSGENNADYAIYLNDFALLLKRMGQYQKAEALYLQSLQIKKNILGEAHPSYINSLNNLAGLYNTMGFYEKAEPILLLALETRKKITGTDHPDYATALNNLAVLYESVGNYEKAEPLYLQAMEIDKKLLGEEHSDYATDLNNLAFLYVSMGKYDKAEPLYLQAVKIRKKVLGKDHPDYATALNNLASLYKSMGNYQKAETLYLEALQINKKTFGEEHADYAYSLNDLALLYKLMGNYKKAEPLYRDALQIVNNVLGKDHPDYTTFLNNLALLYECMGEQQKASLMITEAIPLIIAQLDRQSGYLSEQEMVSYLETVKYNFSFYQSIFMQYHAKMPQVTEESYNIELATKGMLLHSSQQMRQNIMNCGDTSIIGTFKNWLALKKTLAEQYSLPVAQRTVDTRIAEKQANVLEKTLIQNSKLYAREKQLVKTSWKDVQNALTENDVAIEFASFDFRNGISWTDSTYYVALVLRKGDEYPQMIYLCEKRQLDSILNRESTTNDGFVAQLYRGAQSIETDNQSTHGQRLYELIWKPIENLLGNVKNIYYAPSGKLHQLAFAAIPAGDGALLSDKYNLHQLSSTALLVTDRKNTFSLPLSMTIFGGIRYDTGIEQMLANGEKIKQAGNNEILSQSLPEDISRGAVYDYLPGTLQEVLSIDSIAVNKKINTRLITGHEAVEENFKNLSGNDSPTVLHIATHGFFFADPAMQKVEDYFLINTNVEKQVFRQSDNPLYRSGLLFAGANNVWSGKEVPKGIDDGILTAYEVSNCYLPNTDLVVLSACETGLGDIRGSEGVYGLQRSFKIAGARYLIMSLWQVPDKETSEFMKAFYTQWFSGKNIPDAFQSTQKILKNKYRDNPYKWAAFVLME